MKSAKVILIFLSSLFGMHAVYGQSDTLRIIDVVWLYDGSQLKGTILKWDMEKGMTFKLLTGAEIEIPKKHIRKVVQDVSLAEENEKVKYTYVKQVKVYDFRETGWYQNSSVFLNPSRSGGAGINHAMGYRFNRMFGIGLGAGIESNDFNTTRKIIPVYAEARGFFVPKRLSPYYALKVGYGFALKETLFFDEGGSSSATGGFCISPELGLRFGGGDVSYYAGVEYKLQNASFTTMDFFNSGVKQTDKVSYRRVEFRTGLLF